MSLSLGSGKGYDNTDADTENELVQSTSRCQYEPYVASLLLRQAYECEWM